MSALRIHTHLRVKVLTEWYRTTIRRKYLSGLDVSLDYRIYMASVIKLTSNALVELATNQELRG